VVGLASLDGASTRTVELALEPRQPLFGEWPRTQSRFLDRGVGYVRIAAMRDGEYAQAIGAQVGALRGAPAIVLDVRGNGGGSRDVLLAVAPWLLGEGAPPLVVHVARPVRAVDDGPAALASPPLYPADHPRWSDAARAAIAAFARGFTPEWTPQRTELGAPRYLVLERGPAAPPRPFAGKIAVLLDAGCSGDTDVFLAALGELPNAILVGTPSSGGSGPVRELTLPRSGLVVSLSSMVSYRADGRLFEGRGIEPDVLVQPAPGDLVGRGDRVLDAALARLR
jgi:C-terminal processing protease CtpA/Prc